MSNGSNGNGNGHKGNGHNGNGHDGHLEPDNGNGNGHSQEKPDVATSATPQQSAEPPIKPKRKRMPTEEQNKVIEQIRGLLRQHYTHGDIKRAIHKTYGIKRTQIDRYLRVARERQAKALGFTEDEKLARSIAYWSRKLQEAEQRIADAHSKVVKSNESIDAANDAIMAAQAIIDSPNASENAKEAARLRLFAADSDRDAATRRLGSSVRTLASAEAKSASCQQQLDDIHGVKAAIKFARTTTDGKNVDKPAEPVTKAQAEDEIRKLYEQVRAKRALEQPSQN